MRRPVSRCLLVLALAATCCKTEQPPSIGTAPAAETAKVDEKPGKDTLVIAVQADAESFVSVVAQSANDNAIYSNLFLALTDSEFDCRLTQPPGLAERYERAEDGMSITYWLRKDIKWSDGQPVTAADVAFTYDLVADPKVASPRLEHVEFMKPDARPRVLDDYTVRFEFTRAYDSITQFSHCGLEIMPKHILEKYDRGSLRATEFDANPVVSGPWRVGTWKKGESLELVPNENYTGPNPAKLGRVIFKVIPEYAARLIELENGSADMIENFQNLDDIGRMEKEHPEIKMYRRGWRFMDYLGWNLRDPLFKDATVRRALTSAVNRDKIIADLLTLPSGEKLGTPAVSTITPALCDYTTEGVITPIPFDPAKAKEMLASAGWTDTNGDGILDKGGKPFRFTLLRNTGNARREKAAIIVQANLKDIGIDAQIEQVESNQFFERLRKKDFQAALAGWSAGLFVDPSTIWHSDTPGKKYEFNHVSYSNPKADELMDRGLSLPNLQDQIPVWQELQKIIYEDQPYTFLYWRDEVVGVHGRFHDVDCSILSYIKDLNEWWVPESQVKYKY